jgi:thiol-disulfide isomerase/thioredoxin
MRLFDPRLSVSAVLSCLLLAAGCGSYTTVVSRTTPYQGADDPATFLKWSMDQHKALETFQVEVAWEMATDGMPDTMQTKRTIAYEAPNRFRMEQISPHMQMVSVSDGNKLVEYAAAEIPAMSYEAPASLHSAKSMQLGHAMFNGSLLHVFFGGSDAFSLLVDESKPVEFGDEEQIAEGETGRVVKFYAKAGSYGNTKVLISKKTGLVHRIVYDSDDLRKMMDTPEMRQMMEQQTGESISALPEIITTELFSNHRLNEKIEASVFDVTVPEDRTVQQMGAAGSREPAFQTGSDAPDADVVGVDGSRLRLSSLRGQVVLLDFWATWCGPCVAALPKIEKLHKELSSRGLMVVTISDEDKATVEPFLKKNNYTFPAFLDPENSAMKAYKVDALPTLVVIDRNGKIVEYMVGSQPEEKLRAVLAKAGIQ